MEKTKINTLKLQYDAEVTVIKSKLGDIEKIRSELGLSQRKISQLLMVDPSAWTRWMHGKTPVPAHIYRSLQWYMALIDKSPEWHPQNSFMRGFQNTNHTAIKMELDEHKEELEKRLISMQYEQLVLNKADKGKNKLIYWLLAFAGLQSVALIVVFLYKI